MSLKFLELNQNNQGEKLQALAKDLRACPAKSTYWIVDMRDVLVPEISAPMWLEEIQGWVKKLKVIVPLEFVDGISFRGLELTTSHEQAVAEFLAAMELERDAEFQRRFISMIAPLKAEIASVKGDLDGHGSVPPVSQPAGMSKGARFAVLCSLLIGLGALGAGIYNLLNQRGGGGVVIPVKEIQRIARNEIASSVRVTDLQVGTLKQVGPGRRHMACVFEFQEPVAALIIQSISPQRPLIEFNVRKTTDRTFTVTCVSGEDIQDGQVVTGVGLILSAAVQ